MTSDPGLLLRAARSFLSFLSVLRTLPSKCLEIFRRLRHREVESTSFKNLKYISIGKCGIVHAIDDKRVLKEYHEHDSVEVERRVYHRLGSHPSIAKLLCICTDGSLVLERGEPLRNICRAPSAKEIPLQTKLTWLKQAAQGYQHLHDCDILHADVGCTNMIITKDGHLKLIDFEGCSIDGGQADSLYAWYSYRPSIPRVTRCTDIFAFGCAIYELMTGKPPYHEYEKSETDHREVEELYTNNQFPDATTVPLGPLIQSCWYGEVSSMSEIVRELDAFKAT